jgi:hypothetical protein
MTDDDRVCKWFARVTQPQLVVYNERMNDAAPYRNSPRWDRERAKASAEFHDSTNSARELYNAAMAELETLGEISEYVWEEMGEFEKRLEEVPS